MGTNSTTNYHMFKVTLADDNGIIEKEIVADAVVMIDDFLCFAKDNENQMFNKNYVVAVEQLY